MKRTLIVLELLLPFLLTVVPRSTLGLQTTNTNTDSSSSKKILSLQSRNEFIAKSTAATIGGVFTGFGVLNSDPVFAATAKSNTVIEDKKLKLSNDELKKIITNDINERQFLVTGEITRSVYDESATFTDEIDTYTIDKWIKGTKALFGNNKNSELRLVGDVDVTNEKVQFRFDEDLQFNIPLKPTVRLTGKLVLDRNAETGLITTYREYWDQDVLTVLKTAKF